MDDQTIDNPSTTPTEAMNFLPFPMLTSDQMSLFREMLADVEDEAAAQAMLDELIAMSDAGSDNPATE